MKTPTRLIVSLGLGAGLLLAGCSSPATSNEALTSSASPDASGAAEDVAKTVDKQKGMGRKSVLLLVSNSGGDLRFVAVKID